MTPRNRPLPPGPHHADNCGCHHCDLWRKWCAKQRRVNERKNQ